MKVTFKDAEIIRKARRDRRVAKAREEIGMKTTCGRTDRLIYFVRGRTAYHYNCPECEIVLLKRR